MSSALNFFNYLYVFITFAWSSTSSHASIKAWKAARPRSQRAGFNGIAIPQSQAVVDLGMVIQLQHLDQTFNITEQYRDWYTIQYNTIQ